MKYIGTIVNYKGTAGSIFVGEVPAAVEKIRSGAIIKIGYSENFGQSYTLKHWKKNTKGAILDIEGITSKEQVLTLKEQGVFCSQEDIIRDERKPYFDDELLDFIVVNVDDETEIGKVIDYWEMPANDVILVETTNGDLPIPMIEEFIDFIDEESGVIGVIPMEGLFDLLNTENDEDGEDE